MPLYDLKEDSNWKFLLEVKYLVLSLNKSPCQSQDDFYDFLLSLEQIHCVKIVPILSFPDLYFPEFGLNTEGYGVFSRNDLVADN